MQPHLAVTTAVLIKLPSAYQREIAGYVCFKTVGVADIAQYREEDDKEFLVEVDLPLLVHGVQIHRAAVLYDSGGGGDGARPVYLVVSGMEVLQHKKEETAVVLIKLQQCQQYVEQRVALPLAASPCLGYLLLVDDGGVVALVVLVDHYGTVDPYGEAIQKVALVLGQPLLSFGRDDALRAVLAEGQFLAVHIAQQHLGKNKHTVALCGIVVIPHIVHRHHALHVLQGINALQHVAHVGYGILIFFDEDAHRRFYLYLGNTSRIRSILSIRNSKLSILDA